MSPDVLSAPLVYVADFNNNVVDIFSGRTRKQIGEITTGIKAPYGLATDARSNLYVVEQNFANVGVYPRGSKKPILSLMDSQAPTAAAVAPDGTVYVSVGLAGDPAVTGVDVFERGTSTPAYTLQDSSFALVSGVGTDGKGNVYVCGSAATGGGQVVRFKPGKRFGGENLGLVGLANPISILIDSSGNLIIGDYGTSLISVYPPRSTTASKQITSDNVAYLAIDTQSRIWTPSYGGTSVNAFRYPSWASAGVLTPGGLLPKLTGVATSPKLSK